MEMIAHCLKQSRKSYLSLRLMLTRQFWQGFCLLIVSYQTKTCLHSCSIQRRTLAGTRWLWMALTKLLMGADTDTVLISNHICNCLIDVLICSCFTHNLLANDWGYKCMTNSLTIMKLHVYSVTNLGRYES